MRGFIQTTGVIVALVAQRHHARQQAEHYAAMAMSAGDGAALHFQNESRKWRQFAARCQQRLETLE